MRKFIFILILIFPLILASEISKAQDSLVKYPLNIGLGVGVGYCGLGGTLNYSPENYLNMFIGGGTNFQDGVFNIGVAYRILPNSKSSPYIGIMYGYNAVIKIENAEEYNKTYYGTSISFGLEPMRRRNRSFWNIEINVPIRSSQFHDDLNELKSNPNIIFKQEPWPILFSFGYHFSI